MAKSTKLTNPKKKKVTNMNGTLTVSDFLKRFSHGNGKQTKAKAQYIAPNSGMSYGC